MVLIKHFHDKKFVTDSYYLPGNLCFTNLHQNLRLCITKKCVCFIDVVYMMYIPCTLDLSTVMINLTF